MVKVLRKRVRVQLVAPHGADLPTIEGVLLQRTRSEYIVGVPQLLVAAGGNPAELAARHVAIPRDRVAWIEVL